MILFLSFVVLLSFIIWSLRDDDTHCTARTHTAKQHTRTTIHGCQNRFGVTVITRVQNGGSNVVRNYFVESFENLQSFYCLFQFCVDGELLVVIKSDYSLCKLLDKLENWPKECCANVCAVNRVVKFYTVMFVCE